MLEKVAVVGLGLILVASPLMLVVGPFVGGLCTVVSAVNLVFGLGIFA